MSIIAGTEIVKPYVKKAAGYIKSLLSAQHVAMNNGMTLQSTVDEINNNLSFSYIKSSYRTALWKESGTVPFVLSEKQGNCFSLDSSGQVIIGDNVSAVRVYASVVCGSGTNNRAWAYLVHNNTEIDNGLEYGNYAIIKLTNIISVKKNDKISITFYETRGICIDGLSCNLIVEKIY